MNRLEGFRLLVLGSTWILTFAVHATVAHIFALGTAKILVRTPQFRGALWKAALLLPLLTATAATAGWRPATIFADVSLPEIGGAGTSARGQRVWVEQRTIQTNGGPPESTSFITNSRAVVIAAITSALALLASLLGIGRLLARRDAFRRRLGARTRIVACDGAITAPFRLTASTTLGAPVALGINEICVPAGLFTALTPIERQSVLAHERAHLARRDPVWFALADTLVALLPWLPLVRPVVRRLRRDAEFCCDDAAVTHGDRWALVRSLAIFGAAFDPAETALAASCGGSPLEERARRILAPRQPVRSWHALGLGLALLLLLAAVAGAAPVVSTRTSTIGRLPLGAGNGSERRIVILDTRMAGNRH